MRRAVAIVLLIVACGGTTPPSTIPDPMTCSDWSQVEPDLIPPSVRDYCSELADFEDPTNFEDRRRDFDDPRDFSDRG